MADPARMEQILGNLLSNAIKYTDDGGRIELAAERAVDEVVVRVSDDGVGIPESALPLVFEPFVRVGQSLRASGSGLGIGLTLVKKLVELHGGSVTARSEGPGKGSEFVVTLPVHVQGPAASVDEPAPSVVAPAPLRILVVDDNRDLALGIEKVLQALGHDVRLTHDGPEGIDVARRFHPHAALVDIGLPGMDGYEVARQVRQDPTLRDVLLIALSGYGREEDQRRAMGAGFDYHFVKPVNPERLQELVASRGERRSPARPAAIH
jgi:two-component system CheB/CheR fusion protein